MSFSTQTSTNTTPISVAINQIINLVRSQAHDAVVSRLLVEALNRPPRECEEIIHAFHDYLLGLHLGGGVVHETYKKLGIFKPFKIETDPMDNTTSFMKPFIDKCKCHGVHCGKWDYTYIWNHLYRILHLGLGTFYRSPYIQLGAAHARICEDWDIEDDFTDKPSSPSYSRMASESPVYENHGYNCWCSNCCGEDEIYDNTSVQQEEEDKGEPNFAKDDRGCINYHCKRHNKRNIKTSIKRKHSDVSSDEDEIVRHEPEIDPFLEYGMYYNPPLEKQEQHDSDLPEKDSRYHRKNRHIKREKHIRDQEKMARELGIPVARKMKRRDIPTSRYNRHKERIDMEEF
jgi:hypothetical protein